MIKNNSKQNQTNIPVCSGRFFFCLTLNSFLDEGRDCVKKSTVVLDSL